MIIVFLVYSIECANMSKCANMQMCKYADV